MILSNDPRRNIVNFCGLILPMIAVLCISTEAIEFCTNGVETGSSIDLEIPSKYNGVLNQCHCTVIFLFPDISVEFCTNGVETGNSTNLEILNKYNEDLKQCHCTVSSTDGNQTRVIFQYERDYFSSDNCSHHTVNVTSNAGKNSVECPGSSEFKINGTTELILTSSLSTTTPTTTSSGRNTTVMISSQDPADNITIRCFHTQHPHTLNTTPAGTASQKVTDWILIGGIIGGLVLLIIITVIIICFVRPCKRKSDSDPKGETAFIKYSNRGYADIELDKGGQIKGDNSNQGSPEKVLSHQMLKTKHAGAQREIEIIPNDLYISSGNENCKIVPFDISQLEVRQKDHKFKISSESDEYSVGNPSEYQVVWEGRVVENGDRKFKFGPRGDEYTVVTKDTA